MTVKKAREIIREYGKLIIDVHSQAVTHYPRLYYPKSLLPYSKKEIVEAFRVWLSYLDVVAIKDQEAVDNLKFGLDELGRFVDDEKAYTENHQVLGKKDYWKKVKG